MSSSSDDDVRGVESAIIEMLRASMPDMRFLIVTEPIYHEYLDLQDLPIPSSRWDLMFVLDWNGWPWTLDDVIDQILGESASALKLWEYAIDLWGSVIRFVSAKSLMYQGYRAPLLSSIDGDFDVYPYADPDDLAALDNFWPDGDEEDEGSPSNEAEGKQSSHDSDEPDYTDDKLCFDVARLCVTDDDDY
ncbi:hypothetical protein ASPACDRAFT_74037 [Aspergillus aculeatus ATCC 16872]|uniref:Uncharacterized protein n=1 Tax=Aspergillus aculeatus (strain ATCC 16872 / CBS 172.66 / WB 5094) TaxID=690307 RepID=A0A1L9X7V5_ASPA1|nr:uncharacterized protein ASPACDRAFT_74037 [Aspergillus aculeatus ATCC 16872]OJK04414.1 hypothetical protein ASPACDRAFT_74037 [Aspergillus aculeatus ATCC 16872]